MAVDLYSEPSDVSPRISFSHDLTISDIIPVEQAPFCSNSPASNLSFDFDSCGFNWPGSSSSADELFSDGRMIPLFEIKKRVYRDVSRVPLPLPKKKGQEEEAEEETGKNCGNRNMSFWGFRRSSSLNSGGSHGRMGLCPLPLLSRSNSTGSVPAPRMNKHSAPRKPFHPRELPPGTNVVCQKPPMRKPGNIGISRNTVRVDPVLNVAPGNLFGLRSVFVRDKRKRK